MTPSRRLLALTAALLCALVSELPAQVLYDSGGFEPPRFGPGNLEGQDATPPGPWLTTGGPSTAVVQSAVTNGGTQAVRVDRAADPAGDERWSVPTPFTPDASSLLNVQFSLSVLQSSGVDFGPAFGVELYGLSPENALLLIGSVTVDAATSEVLYQAAGSGVLTPTGAVVTPGAFNQFVISADFSQSLYTIFMNGSELVSETFVDGPVASFSDATIAALAASGGAGLSAAGTAYFDNYRVTVVPEPATTALLVIGACGALAVHRRRRTA